MGGVGVGRRWVRVAAIGVLSITGLLVPSCADLGPAIVSAPTARAGDGASTGQGPRRCEDPAPGADFEPVAPQEVGIDPAAVRATIDQLATPVTTSFRIYRYGCLVGQTRRDLTSATEPAQLFSMTKSVVGLAVGRAVTLGLVGLDDPIGRYLTGLDPAHGAITVRQLLTQTSGLRFAWANDLAGSTEDSVAQAMSLSFAHQPGTFFEYAQTTVTTLTAVVASAAGRDFQSFVSAELLEPLGIRPGTWTWAHDGAGNTQGYAWLQMRPVDVARLGTLVLRRGTWRGHRLLDESYVDELDDGTAANPGYGFLVQTNAGRWNIGTFGGQRKEHRVVPSAPADTVLFSGFLEQGTFVVPSLGLVIVRLGFPPEGGWRDHIFRNLLPGIPEAAPFEGPLASPDGIDIDWNALIDVGELIRRNDARRASAALG